MTRFAAAGALVAVLVASIAASASARAGSAGATRAMPAIAWGVADDASKYATDGGSWFYGELKGASLTQNRWTLAWDSSNPEAINERPFLERAAPKAQEAGVRVLLSLYSTKASEHDPAAFCAWAAKVAQTVSVWGIHDYIVWNEPNTRLYWSPQRDGAGNDVAAPAYESLLATCYDALHAADPAANVIAMGLSPRASTGESNEPLVFLRDVGAATVGLGARRSAGAGNLLTFVVDELGWQTDTAAYPQYANQENVATVDEATQARYLRTAVERYLACDPTVTSVELFLLVDERYRNGRDGTGRTVGGGWQSGLLTAGGEGVSTPKLAYSQVGSDFAGGRAACTGAPVSWSPSAVVPASTHSSKPGKSTHAVKGKKAAHKPPGKLRKKKHNRH